MVAPGALEMTVGIRGMPESTTWIRGGVMHFISREGRSGLPVQLRKDLMGMNKRVIFIDDIRNAVNQHTVNRE
jgi:hypothetical protein